MTTILQVLHSHPLVQLQDAGRFGVRHVGISQAGTLDWHAHAVANALLGNQATAPVIEISLGNCAFLCTRDTTLALAGADLGATLDGQSVSPNRSFGVHEGQCLKMAAPIAGARAYLAAPGGFAAQAVLGSCATLNREALGGLHGDGRALEAGDQLSSYSNSRPPARVAPPHWLAIREEHLPLRLILGAQVAQFSGSSLFALFNHDWQIDARADRMGMRLSGPALHYQGSALISEPIALGSVQVQPDGQPIALLNDRQTIGGYPRLGALCPMSVARLAQRLPGQHIRLQATTQEAAQAAFRQLHRQGLPLR